MLLPLKTTNTGNQTRQRTSMEYNGKILYIENRRQYETNTYYYYIALLLAKLTLND